MSSIDSFMIASGMSLEGQNESHGLKGITPIKPEDGSRTSALIDAMERDVIGITPIQLIPAIDKKVTTRVHISLMDESQT